VAGVARDTKGGADVNGHAALAQSQQQRQTTVVAKIIQPEFGLHKGAKVVLADDYFHMHTHTHTHTHTGRNKRQHEQLNKHTYIHRHHKRGETGAAAEEQAKLRL